MIIQMFFSKKTLLFLGLCLFIPEAYAVPFSWASRSGESSFTLDVPESWRQWQSVKRNGVIVQFRHRRARIEVRSFAAKDSFSPKQILGQKAARLSAENKTVKYLGESPGDHARELAISSWQVRVKGAVYLDQTAVILAPEGPIIVSCYFRAEDKEKYRTACMNAFYSLTAGAEIEAPAKPAAVAAKDIGAIYFLHVPSNLPAIDLSTLTKKPEPVINPTPPRPQYDENYILPDEANPNR